MKYLIQSFVILTIFLSVSCKQAIKETFDGTVALRGTLSNVPAGKLVLLRYVDQSTETVHELPLANGDFGFEVAIEQAGFYDLDLGGRKTVKLALYAQDVEISYDFGDEGSLKIEGSTDSQNLQMVEALVTEYQNQVNELNTAYFEAMSKRDQEAILGIQTKAQDLEIKQSEKVKTALGEMKGSFAALAGISMLNPKVDFQFIDELVSGLNEQYPNNKMIQSMMAQLDDMRALSIGQLAPDINLPNPQGDFVKLSDLRGKYVLIDFWAAWCKPCREENPNVVRLYNQYKEKGFEVFGVSLDRTKEAWLKAIADDNLTWVHVSDLKYFNSEAAALYQINAIPATYMLDPDGKIIAKDLRAASLENKLKELFD